MNYYRINHSLDPKVIGKIPFGQADTAEFPGMVDDPTLITNHLFERKDLAEMLAPTPILRPKAKLTDLISGVVLGQSIQLMISDKLKRILETAGHHGLQFFPMDIIHRGERLPGFWIAHPVEFDMGTVNYAQSRLQVNGYGGMKLRDAAVGDFAAFTALKGATQYPERLQISKLVIDERSEQPLLLLQQVTGGVGYYVSEVMKQKIETEGCTGIVFTQPGQQYPL